MTMPAVIPERPPAETLWRRLFRGVWRIRQVPHWPHFAGAGWRENIMQASVTDCFHAKQGRSTGRWILRAGGQQLSVYLKRHYHLPWWRGLLAALWPERGWSPALREWQRLAWAEAQGMPVPKAVAAGEWIGPWFRLQSFLAIEELADMLPLHEAIPVAQATLPPAVFRKWKRSLIAELARLTRELHARHWFHKDLYLCHFYIPRQEIRPDPRWRGRVYLIDLHRLAHHSWTRLWWQIKDLAQFLYSSEIPGINDADRLAFWRAYLGPARRHWAAPWLRHAVLLKWRRYRRHNARRQQSVSLDTMCSKLRSMLSRPIESGGRDDSQVRESMAPGGQ